MPSVKLLDSTKTSVSEETSPQDTVASVNAVGIEPAQENSAPAAQLQQPSSNNSNKIKEALSHVQQMCLIIEHKIRNLEKRKNKLDSYKLLEKEGKQLSNDQKMAILKYDECVTSLELARELCKQFSAIATVATKEAKRQAKQNAFLKVQQENAKIRECLVILDILSRFSEEVVRLDFLSGSNGACQLSETDIDLLMVVYDQTKPKRPVQINDKSFSCAVKCASEVLSSIVDGKSKPFGCSSFAYVKSILNSIENSGYFEKQTILNETNECVSEEGNEKHLANACDLEEQQKIEPLNLPTLSTTASATDANIMENKSLIFSEAPAATAVPTPSFPYHGNDIHSNAVNPPQVSIPTIHSHPSSVNTNVAAEDSMQSAVIVPAATYNLPIVSHVSPALQLSVPPVTATTVQAVENAYFKHHYMQNQLRPLHEVLGNVNFYFLQESEIDKPDIPSLHNGYVPVDQPIANLHLQAAGNEFHQFTGVADTSLMLSAQTPIHNSSHCEPTPNVIITNSGVGSNGNFNNRVGMVNEGSIMNIHQFQGPIVHQNSLCGLQLLPSDVKSVPNEQAVSMGLPAPSFGQSEHVNKNTSTNLRGFASTNATIPATLSETNVQELTVQPQMTQATVQTNTTRIITRNNVLKDSNELHDKSETIIVAPVSIVSNDYADIETPNLYSDSNINKPILTPLNASSDALHESAKTELSMVELPLNEAVKKIDKNECGSITSDESYPSKLGGKSNRKKPCFAKGDVDERKEWMKRSLANKNEQWPLPSASVALAQSKKDESLGHNDLNSIRSSGNCQTVDAGIQPGRAHVSSDQYQFNGETVNVKSDNNVVTTPNSNPNIRQTHGVSAQTAAYRNNRSSNQYSQNVQNNGCFNAENGSKIGHPPTFFKNNERFYQNNFGPHRGGAMYKGRCENLGENIGSRSNNNNAYSTTSSPAAGNGHGNSSAVTSEYRSASAVRAKTNSKNNVSFGTRSHQRNNATNLTYPNHSKKDTSGRTQSGVNF